jgi:hypothetical protein
MKTPLFIIRLPVVLLCASLTGCMHPEIHQSANPVLSIKPPIVPKQLLWGMCTGDHKYKFTTRDGAELEIRITRPITVESIRLEQEHKPDTRPWTVSVVFNGLETITADGDVVQKRILQLVSNLAAQIRAEAKRDSVDDCWLDNLEALIKDLRSRQVPKLSK